MTAAAVTVSVVLGVTGCGTTDGGGAGKPGGATAAPSSARPEETGPFTKERARADVDAATADAGAPPADPEWAKRYEDAPAGSVNTCLVAYRGYATEAAPVDLGRFEAVLGELRERGWQEQRPKDGVEHKADEMAEAVLTKRGWSLVVEFRALPETDHYVDMMAFGKACVDKHGGINPPPGLDLGS